MAKYLMVDPPSGWMYGFPKAVTNPEVYKADPIKWFVNNGYPQRLINEGMLKWVRYWEAEIEDASICD